MILELNNSVVQRPELPVRILQFGEGNFLRAFADWAVDIANDKGVARTGIVICKPRAKAHGVAKQTIDILREQDNLFHVYLEGVENKQPKRDVRLVKSVVDSLNPYEEYQKYEQYILSPELRFVISNTTEAGICFIEGDNVWATPPESFPAKMMALLYRRFKHFAGDRDKGLVIICCELIENNGSTLKEYVLRHANNNKLEQEFIDWIEQACCFCDSLVDRIVSGFPDSTIDEIKQELGYNDNAVVVGELYHLWVIGGDGYQMAQSELPLDKAGLNVVFTPSIREFRDKKVRILNGSHTGMVAMGLLMGCQTVVDAFNTPDIERFIIRMVEQEVIPTINENKASLKFFADSILERFYNPYIKHMLKSISLNSLSKWETRNYPTLWENWVQFGRLAEFECMTFAALLAYYSPKSGFEPDDNADHIAYIRKIWDSDNLALTVEKIVCESGIFSVDLYAISGFIPTVAMYLSNIEQLGMAAALKKFLG